MAGNKMMVGSLAIMALLGSFVAIVTAEDRLLLEEIIRKTVNQQTGEYAVNYTIYEEDIVDMAGMRADDNLEKFTPGMVSQQCLQCICLQESGCRAIGCRMDVGSLSCGYFQIKAAYWQDCGRPGGDWKRCADDLQCASECVQNYMKRYARHYGCPLNCEGFAREHNGGPRGCKNPNTLGYWNALRKQKGCAHVTL